MEHNRRTSRGRPAYVGLSPAERAYNKGLRDALLASIRARVREMVTALDQPALLTSEADELMEQALTDVRAELRAYRAKRF